MKKLLMVFVIVGLTAGLADASILPGISNQKWETSLEGFAKVYHDEGSSGVDDDVWRLRNLVISDSDFKSQGDVTGLMPHEFKPGRDSLSGKVADQGYPGILGMMTTGLRLIAVDENTGSGTYTRHSTNAQLLTYFSGAAPLAARDILYFGAEANITPYVWAYSDPTSVLGDFSTPYDGWDATGNLFTNTAGNSFGQGDDTLLLQMGFKDLGDLEVDGTWRPAPSGTFVANVLADGGSVRPMSVMEVIGGTEANLVVSGAVKSTFRQDTDGDLIVEAGTAVPVVGDFVAAFGATPPDDNGFSTLSDPAEWVSTPEPATLAVWGVLGLCGVGFWALRRRNRR